MSSLSSLLSVAGAVSSAQVEESRDEEDPLPILQQSGLHPNDDTAQVSVHDPNAMEGAGAGVAAAASASIYAAAESFEALGLSPQLLSGVTELKFTRPSKIQAQALPLILSPKHPNLIGQAHHGSGKTAAFSLGVLSRVDASRAVPQALVVVPTRELALQVHAVMSQLAKYTSIQVYLAVPAHVDVKRERPQREPPITAQVVVGTPGKLQSKLQYRDIDPRHVMMFIADEADQMVNQEGFAEVTLQIRK